MYRKRICIVATVPSAIKAFMRVHVGLLSVKHDVTLVANGSADDLSELLGDHVFFRPLQIKRKISIKDDILSLVLLWNLFRKEKFDCVHSIMPKSGLLSMVAARLSGVPLRVHTFTGQVWATQTGLRRSFLKLLDKILAMNATRVLADSQSQRLFLIDNKVVKCGSIDVLADGSIAGVDINRFKYNEGAHHQIRLNYQIPRDAVVFLFVGRLTYDKGLMDLSRAFAMAAKQNESIHLLVVGQDEDGLDVEFSTLAARFLSRVHRACFTDCPEDYMSAADVLCLPSYREGFGSVIIEAAAVGLPSIASRIYGIIDAVEDRTTGILHCPASDREIAEAMLLFASNKEMRRRMGAAARERVVGKFSELRVAKALFDFYDDILTATS